MVDGQDKGYADQTEERLKEAGFHINRFPDAQLEQWKAGAGFEPPELLLIDIEQRGQEEIASLIRFGRKEELLPYPVIAASGRLSTQQLLEAFSAGANDYVSKTVPIKELIARIENLVGLFHRMEHHERSYIYYEDLRIETKKQKVFRGEDEISLTPKEYDLLLYLTRHRHEICTRETILQEVWGYDFSVNTNVVDVYIKHIRSKLDAGHQRKLIHTVRGAGYMLQ